MMGALCAHPINLSCTLLKFPAAQSRCSTFQGGLSVIHLTLSVFFSCRKRGGGSSNFPILVRKGGPQSLLQKICRGG